MSVTLCQSVKPAEMIETISMAVAKLSFNKLIEHSLSTIFAGAEFAEESGRLDYHNRNQNHNERLG